MKVSCEQRTLEKGLSIVSRAVANRPSLPVLTHVLLQTGERSGHVMLAGSDLELFVTCSIAAQIEQSGSFTVPARLAGDLVKTLPTERVDLNLDGALHLSCGKTQADVKGISAEEFPFLPDFDEATGVVEIQPYVLAQVLKQVVFSASTDESRPILTGALMRTEDNVLTMAAADGFRLSVRKVQLDTGVEKPISVVVPAKALKELARFLGEEGDAVKIALSEQNQILFRLAGNAGANEGRVLGIDVASQLIEGKYVNYSQIIPTSHKTRTVVSRSDFLRACKRAQIFAHDEADLVDLRIEEGQVTVSGESAERGENTTVIEAEVEGESIEISFNVAYLVEVLGVIDSPKVALETTSAASPGVIKPVSDDDFVHIIMPMHRKEG